MLKILVVLSVIGLLAGCGGGGDPTAPGPAVSNFPERPSKPAFRAPWKVEWVHTGPTLSLAPGTTREQREATERAIGEINAWIPVEHRVALVARGGDITLTFSDRVPDVCGEDRWGCAVQTVGKSRGPGDTSFRGEADLHVSDGLDGALTRAVIIHEIGHALLGFQDHHVVHPWPFGWFGWQGSPLTGEAGEFIASRYEWGGWTEARPVGDDIAIMARHDGVRDGTRLAIVAPPSRGHWRGSAEWRGGFLGFEPDGRKITGDTEIRLSNTGSGWDGGGSIDFDNLHEPGTSYRRAPVAYRLWMHGSGKEWRNVFFSEGNEVIGRVLGEAHKYAAGTLRRHDLTGAFAAKR